MSELTPKADEIKEAISQVNTAFEEFKATNDARLVEIEKKGHADPLLDEKLAKIETTISAYEGLSQKMVLVEKQKEAIDGLTEQFGKLSAAINRKGNPDVEKKNRVNDWAKAVVNAHIQGVPNLSDEQKDAITGVVDEYKALGLTPDTAGGYLAPIEFVQEIIKGITLISPVRSLARVRQTANKTIQIPKRTGQIAAQWVADQGTKVVSSGTSYGLEELPMHEFAAVIEISNGMLEDSAFNMQAEINEESVDQFSVTEGAAFVNGSGVGRPEGFMVNSGVTTTNSGAATAITADGIISMKHAVKSGYARVANFVLNRTTLGSVRKLTTTTGQYIWQPGLASGTPNTLDGDPYVELPDMPSEGAGLKPIAYGDFRRAYTWVDRISMEMLRDPYTQALAGNVRFIMRKRVGGKVVLAEAIQTMTCAV